MNVITPNNILHTPVTYTARHTKQNNSSQDVSRLHNPVPSFGSNCDNEVFVDRVKFQKYKQAQKYVDDFNKSFKPELQKKLGFKLRPLITVYDFDKIEGIQYGINVFEGLNIKQIAILYKYIHSICTSRACSNGCVHCYAEAKPFHIEKNNTDTIKQMSWEDFTDLTKGFKELNRRFDNTINSLTSNDSKHVVPFVDADSMEICIKDKNGKEHDMIDIAKRLKNDMGKNVLFDTSGWNPKDKKLQERAQKYVNYVKKQADNGEYDLRCQISLNPFHKLHSKYVEYIKSEPDRAQKFRELYTDRMANVFFTFTPVFDEIHVLNRALDDKSKCDENYKIDAQIQLISEIRDKLEAKYKAAPSYSRDDITRAMEKFDRLTSNVDTQLLGATGRMEKLLDETDPKMHFSKELHETNRLHPEKITINRENDYMTMFVDANGKVYATDEYNTVPTDIRLNFRNKNKKTPPIFGLIDRVVTTEELLKDWDLYNKKHPK